MQDLFFCEGMDCRVKPGNDERKTNGVLSLHPCEPTRRHIVCGCDEWPRPQGFRASPRICARVPEALWRKEAGVLRMRGM